MSERTEAQEGCGQCDPCVREQPELCERQETAPDDTALPWRPISEAKAGVEYWIWLSRTGTILRARLCPDESDWVGGKGDDYSYRLLWPTHFLPLYAIKVPGDG